MACLTTCPNHSGHHEAAHRHNRGIVPAENRRGPANSKHGIASMAAYEEKRGLAPEASYQWLS